MTTERVFDSPPGTLTLFARAGAAMIPGASRLPFVGGGGKDVPDLVLTLADVSIDRDRVAEYSRVCEFAKSSTLPPTYPHILAFPLHLALMTDGSFPFPAIGLVHIENQITQHRPITDSETLSLRVWATPIEPHPRGRQFSVCTEASVDGEVVWEEVSTNLRRGGGSGAGGGKREGRDEDPPTTATWSLAGDLGRRYASVSGDMNPIHIHPLTARLFGFPSAIAHGMWTKARCLAALQDRLPGAFTVKVSFRRPILLPAKVEFAEREQRFQVRDAKKGSTHLDGSLTAA
jgi:acyl dehydratase